MKPIKHKWLVTNGNLGTLDQTIVRYSSHPNGIRALMAFIQEHANRTGLKSWAETMDIETPNRYYPRHPQH